MGLVSVAVEKARRNGVVALEIEKEQQNRAGAARFRGGGCGGAACTRDGIICENRRKRTEQKQNRQKPSHQGTIAVNAANSIPIFSVEPMARFIGAQRRRYNFIKPFLLSGDARGSTRCSSLTNPRHPAREWAWHLWKS